MGKKKVTRKAVSKQPTKQLTEILRLRRQVKNLKATTNAAQINTAKEKELQDKLWHAQHEVQALKAQVCGDLGENLNDFAFWTWLYAAPLLKSTSEILDHFDRGSVGDIEEHREEIAHALSYALKSLGQEVETRARVALHQV